MNVRLAAVLLALCPAAHAVAAESWTGAYLGAHVGQSRADSDAHVTLGGQWSIESQALRDEFAQRFSQRMDGSATTWGLQGGYRHQFDGGFVLGAELDYSHGGADDFVRTGAQPTTAFPSLSYDFRNSFEIRHQTSLRGIVGYAHGQHLVFASAGATRVGARATAAVTSNGGYDKLGTASDTLSGTTWGVGYAYDFGNRWALRVEYLRSNVDDLTFSTAYQPGSSFTTPPYTESVRQSLDSNVLRVGIDYRF